MIAFIRARVWFPVILVQNNGEQQQTKGITEHKSQSMQLLSDVWCLCPEKEQVYDSKHIISNRSCKTDNRKYVLELILHNWRIL